MAADKCARQESSAGSPAPTGLAGDDLTELPAARARCVSSAEVAAFLLASRCWRIFRTSGTAQQASSIAWLNPLSTPALASASRIAAALSLMVSPKSGWATNSPHSQDSILEY